ncbi:MAG: hypothetical protein ACI9FR_001567, partial [Cryomorphaceae bacterium]
SGEIGAIRFASYERIKAAILDQQARGLVLN